MKNSGRKEVAVVKKASIVDKKSHCAKLSG